MTHTMHARLSRLERTFLPPTHAPMPVYLVATDEEEAAARQYILAENADPDDDHIRIIRLAAPEASS